MMFLHVVSSRQNLVFFYTAFRARWPCPAVFESSLCFASLGVGLALLARLCVCLGELWRVVS